MRHIPARGDDDICTEPQCPATIQATLGVYDTTMPILVNAPQQSLRIIFRHLVHPNFNAAAFCIACGAQGIATFVVDGQLERDQCIPIRRK